MEKKATVITILGLGLALGVALYAGVFSTPSQSEKKSGTESNSPTFPHQVPKQRGKASGKEIIIARGGKEGSIVSAYWCGSNAVVYHFGYLERYTREVLPKSHGIYWVDLASRKGIKLDLGKNPGLFGCSPDGKWVVYDLEGSKGLWRYNIKTSQKQKFVAAALRGIWSPDGKKLLFYHMPKPYIKMPYPRWKIVTLYGKYPSNGLQAVWMADSRSILIRYQSDPNDHRSKFLLGVEKYINSRPVFKRIDTDFNEISGVWVDHSNRVYIIIDRYNQIKTKAMTRLLRCQLSGDKLQQCENVLKKNKKLRGFNISHDGKKIAFEEEGNPCIMLITEEVKKTECVSTRDYGSVLIFSPDGKRLLFTKEPSNELFVIKLIRE